MSTLETLQDILIDKYGLSRDQLSPDVALNSLNIDSLGLIELMFHIEDTFHITLPDDETTNFSTINDVVIYLNGLLLPPVPMEAAGKVEAGGVT